MFKAIAKFSVKFRWLIIIFWIAAVPIVTANFPNINDVSKNNTSDFLPKNSPTDTASKLETAFQHKDTATNSVIVASRGGARLSDSDNAALRRAVANVQKVKEITEVRDLGASADGQAHEYIVGISGAGFGQGATDIVANIRTALHKSNLPSGLKTNLTGDLAAGVDQENANSKGRNSTEIYSVIMILALLLLVFRSILAPIVTLLPAGLALAIAQPVIAESTKAGVQVGFITQILLIVLLLGAGTDYGLFLVFRVREEMRGKGLNSKDAVVEALSHVGESITFSAATVIAALLSLTLATFGLYKGLGPALAIGLVLMLLISLTFLPALLSILGRAVFWPSKTSKREAKFGLWGRLADRVIKKPILMLVVGAVLFGGLSLGLVGYKSAGFGDQTAPAGSDSAAGSQVIDKHFPAANDNPQLLIFHFKSSVWNNAQPVAKAQSELAASKTFKAISGPLNANGFVLTPAQLRKIHNSGTPAETALGQFISDDGKTVQFYGVLSAGKTGSTAALNAVPAVRTELQKVADSVAADKNSIYSADSVGYDVNKTASHDLKKIIPVVLIIIAGLLAILLRSLVAPWYLIATVGLSYLASLGFAMIVFVHIYNQDGLNFVLPFLMFIFGMALGQDYNILVMSRIREEAHHHKSLFEAVTKAVGITGTTVTSAGLILAGTFTILGIVGGNEQVQQIGFGIAFGILLDTFFVRTLLVPAIVALLGRWNWWPSKLSSK
jgi:putative drug exporter of the RND superfamily